MQGPHRLLILPLPASSQGRSRVGTGLPYLSSFDLLGIFHPSGLTGSRWSRLACHLLMSSWSHQGFQNLKVDFSSLCPTGFLWRSKVVMHMKMVCIIIQSLCKYDSSLLLIVRREDWQRTDYPGRWCAPALGQEVCYSLVNKNKGSQIK